MKKLYLVDVSNLFFRAFYAIPRLTNLSGTPTNALYGFVGMTIKLLREHKPDYIAFCLDQPEPSFRDEIYSEYKANRVELPDDLGPQFPYLRPLIEVMGLPIVEKKRFEADDVIGTLAQFGSSQDIEVVIVSGDKDFSQLVKENIFLLDTMKNVKYDRTGVIEKWGLPPEQMIDYLAIVGDTSDNIPGIHGVGPKGAVKLLTEYKTLDNIYKNLDSIKSESLKSKISESREKAFLAQKLVKIVTDVDLNLKLDDLKLRPLEHEKLESFFNELDFSALTKKFIEAHSKVAVAAPTAPGADSPKSTTVSVAPTIMPTATDEKAAFNSNSKVETSPSLSLDELKGELQKSNSIWCHWNERGVAFSINNKIFQVNARTEELSDFLSQHNLNWSGFDLKSLWKNLNIQAGRAQFDTMLAAHLILSKPVESFSEVYSLVRNEDLPELLSACEALEIEMQVQSDLLKRLNESQAIDVLNKIELPVIPILSRMERAGILLDVSELQTQSLSLSHDISSLEKKIHEMAGSVFNIASPKQLGAILFEKIKMPVIKKTKTGYSTDNDVLSQLSDKYPIAKLIIEYRELSKLKSTYVDALPALVSPDDQRLHTTFQQALTATGRLSSINPNLQNIPIRTDRGRLIRKAFIAPQKKVLLSADYSQIELRVLAEITQDPGLIEAFKKDRDVHAATAAEIFEVDLADVTSDQRRMAKAVNFGIAYGQGVFGLAETLSISRDEAKKIIDSYFKKFKKIKDYMSSTIEAAKEKYYVETLYGRRRYIHELKAQNQAVRKFGERAAINAPMQGTASDIVKKAMIAVDELIASQKLSAKMLLQVHDELLFELLESEVKKESALIKTAMETVVSLNVPLVVNVAWGKNWDEAH